MHSQPSDVLLTFPASLALSCEASHQTNPTPSPSPSSAEVEVPSADSSAAELGRSEWFQGPELDDVDSNDRIPVGLTELDFSKRGKEQKGDPERTDVDPREQVVEPHSPERELQVLSSLNAICQGVLNGYDTSLDEDLALLETDKSAKNLSVNMRHAIVLRAGEKRLLTHWAKLAQHVLNVVSQCPWSYVGQYLHAVSQESHANRVYIKEVWQTWLD